MTEIAFNQERLKTLVGTFLSSIQMGGSVDLSLGREIVAMSKELARALKGHELIPKTLINELHSTSKILRGEIPHIRVGANDAEQIANELDYSFDLILRGESHEDRAPGVPRII